MNAARLKKLEQANDRMEMTQARVEELIDALRESQAREAKLREALEMGAFHHPACPYYRSEECLCARKKVDEALKEGRKP